MVVIELELAVDHTHRCVERERNGRAGRLKLAAHVHASVAQPGEGSVDGEPHLLMLGDVEEVG